MEKALPTATWRSQNRRWGTQVVGLSNADAKGAHRGTLRSLGRAGGLDCFEFSPDAGGDIWVVIGDDLEPVPDAGAVTVQQQGLQGGDEITILVATPGALWRSWDYKRRGVSIKMLTPSGEIIEPPPAILLAAGLLSAKPESIKEIPTPPPIGGQLAAALRAAGIV
jgi:hypothetical protein